MTQVQLIFQGEVLDGFVADDVRRRLAERLKLDEPTLARLFTGKPVVIKRGLSAEVAHQWVAQFRALGARLHARDEKPAAPASPPPAASLPPLPRTPVAAATPTPGAVPPPPAGLQLVPLAGDPHAAPAPAPIAPSATYAGQVDGETITCPVCGEVQPKRILCRACAADMPRGIAAKEEEAAAERARRHEEWLARRGRRPGSPADRGRVSRLAEPTVEIAGDDEPLFGLSFEGRIGRMRYFLGLLLFLLGLFWGFILIALIPGFMTAMLLFVGLAVATVWNLRLTVLRLHDVGLRGWWVLASYIPWVGQIGSLVLMLWPGQAEGNEHGDPPSQDAEGAKAAVAALVALSLSVGWGFKTAISAFEEKVAEMQAEAGEDDEMLEDDEGGGGIEASLPPAGDLKRVLRSDLAVDEFRRYMAAPGHRAFTVSDGGAWGWHGGAARPNQAVETALADCERRRKPYTPDCRVVHVNNDWAMQ